MTIVKNILKAQIYAGFRTSLAAARGIVESDLRVGLNATKASSEARIIFLMKPSFGRAERMWASSAASAAEANKRGIKEEWKLLREAIGNYQEELISSSLEEAERVARLSELQ